MTKKYTSQAYITLFNMLDLRFNKSKDSELGRLLSDMNPDLFIDDTSADSACFEDYLNCCASYESDLILNAYNASVEFLKLYCNEFGFEIMSVIEDVSLQEYEHCFDNIINE